MLNADQEILKAAIDSARLKVALKEKELRDQKLVLDELVKRCTGQHRFGKCVICGTYTQGGRD